MTTSIANIDTNAIIPNVELKLGSIEIKNKEEISDLLKVADKYRGLIITSEDDFKYLKEQRARLKEADEKINRYRIDYKDEAYKPIAKFESQMKEFSGIVMDAHKDLDRTVKAYEQKLKDDKRIQVDELIKKYSEERPIEFSSKWLNKTMTLSKIKDEIIEQVEQQKSEEEQELKSIETIKQTAEKQNLTVDGYVQLLKAGKDVLEIISLINDEGEKKRATEEYNARMASEMTTPLHSTVETVKLEAEEVSVVEPEPAETGEIFHDTIKISGTMTQLNKLNEAIKALGIAVVRV